MKGINRLKHERVMIMGINENIKLRCDWCGVSEYAYLMTYSFGHHYHQKCNLERKHYENRSQA